ncbi:hypothetical protein WJR50_28560 [Catalinimonas sp. 4WD22]|uniref:P-loop ATPase, Sll1717 family n=1 Tax=Catalinimonas locisalis TaxID=3133978 RepID=UPI00310181E6
MSQNSYKFKRNIDIGSLDAENDRFLIAAFVDKNDLTLLSDMSNPKSILIGRTGSGKSALIKYLEKNEQYIKRIDPESISLRHLSNSDIIQYFKKLNVKLDLFYKVLWKHVFIVELIKLYYDNNIDKSKSIIDWLKNQLPNKAKQSSLDYLEKWEDKFWENTEYRIKEMETSLENRFKGELGGQVDIKELFKVLGKVDKESKDSNTIKYEVINKAQKVVNESQIEHINNILDIMETKMFIKSQKKFFIIIDDLDKEWVSNTIVYDLLKALIETIKDLSRISNFKIVIALRTNIHKKILKSNLVRGVQREKYNHLYLDIKWSESELMQLLNNRLRELMRGTYTSDSPTVEDVLPEAKSHSKKQISGFDYLVQRTFMRPRDVIDFFNKCIKHADGKTRISREILRLAEDEYSHERLRALNDEWIENYGNLFCLYGFLKGKKDGFKRDEIVVVAEEYFVEIIGNDEIKNLNDELQSFFNNYGNDFEAIKLLNKVLITLYETGLLGIKIGPETKTEYIYESYTAIESSDLTPVSKFYVHPMFKKALRIK